MNEKVSQRLCLLGFAAQLALAGCGSDGSSTRGSIGTVSVLSDATVTATSTITSTSTSSTSTLPVSMQSADLRLEFTLQARQVPVQVDSFRITGLSAQGDALFGPLTVAKQPSVLLAGVPTSVRKVRVELLVYGGVRGLASLDVQLVAGQQLVLRDPDFADVAAVLQRLTVEAPFRSLVAGNSTRLSARTTFNDGHLEDVSSSVRWSSSDSDIISVDADGTARARAAGSAVLTARFGTLQATLSLQVTAAVLTSVRFDASPLSLVQGLTAQPRLLAVLSDGSTQLLSQDITWSSDNDSVASVTRLTGEVTAQGTGTANLGASFAGFQATLPVTVRAVALDSLSVEGDATVARDQTTRLTLVGHYNDGTQQPLSAGVTWTSSDESVVTVLNSGVATGHEVGSSVITATDGASGTSVTYNLTVSGAALDSLRLTPVFSYVWKNETLALHVQGIYHDGTTRDLTDSVTYSTNGPAVSVSNSAATRGQVSGQTVGRNTVTAVDPRTGLQAQVQVRTLNFVRTGSLAYPARVAEMVRDTTGSRVYVLSTDALRVVDVATRQIVSTSTTLGGSYLDLSPDGTTLLIANGTDTLRVVDTQTLTQTPLVTTGGGLRGVAWDDNSRAFVLGNGTLSTLDVPARTVTNRLSSSAFDNTTLLKADPISRKLFVSGVGNYSGVQRCGISGSVPVREETTGDAGANGYSLVVNPGRGVVYTSGGGSLAGTSAPATGYKLTYFSPFSFIDNFLGVFHIGTYPIGAAFSPDGELLFGANADFYDQLLTVSRTDTCATLHRVAWGPGGSQPSRMAATGDGAGVLLYSESSSSPYNPQLFFFQNQ